MMKRRMVQAVSLCCLLTLAIAGCSKTSRRPSQPSDSDGLPNRSVVIIADVEEKIAPPPQDDAPAAPTAAPADAPAAAPAAAPVAPAPAPAPAPAAPAVVPAAVPAPAAAVEPAQPKPNPLKAAFDKKDVLAVAEETPSQPAPVAPAPAPAAALAETTNATAENLEVTAVRLSISTFAVSVEKADEKTFKEKIVYTKAEEPIIKTMWAMITEMSGFEKDMEKAYGQAGLDAIRKNQQMRIGAVVPSPEDIENKLVIKVSGNTAKATMPGQPQPMTLVKDNGQWKVQLIPPGQMQGPQANMAVAMMKGMTQGVMNARKTIGQPGMTPEKVMQEVSKGMMMPNPAMMQNIKKK